MANITALAKLNAKGGLVAPVSSGLAPVPEKHGELFSHAGRLWVSGGGATKPALLPVGPTPITHTHVQAIAASTWTINHNFNLPGTPAVVAWDETNTPVAPIGVTVTSKNQVIVAFGRTVAGSAVLTMPDSQSLTSIRLGGVGLTADAGKLAVDGINVSLEGHTHDTMIPPSGDDGSFLTILGNSPQWGGATAYHGFPNRTDSVLTYNRSTRTVAVAQAGGVVFWFKGRRIVGAPTISAQHPATAGSYWYVMNSDGTVSIQTTAWDLDNQVPLCEVFWDGSKGIAWEERHGHSRNIAFHRYLHNTLGTMRISVTDLQMSGYTLHEGTSDASLKYAVGTGTILDEDISVVTRALPSGGPYLLLSRTSSGAGWAIDDTSVVPFARGTYIQYDNGGTLTDLADGEYVCYWVLATTTLSGVPSVFSIAGQQKHASFDEAANESYSQLSLSGFPVKECVPIYRLIFQAGVSFTTTGKCILTLVEALDPLAQKRITLPGAPNAAGLPTVKNRLTAAVASVSTALATVTGMNIQLSANTMYRLTYFVRFQSTATGTGIRLGLVAPAGSSISATVSIPVRPDSTSGVLQGALISSRDSVLGTGVEAANTPYVATIFGMIQTGANGGTLSLQFATEINGSQVSVLPMTNGKAEVM